MPTVRRNTYKQSKTGLTSATGGVDYTNFSTTGTGGYSGTTSTEYVYIDDFKSPMLQKQNEHLEEQVSFLKQQIENLRKEKKIVDLCQEALLNSIDKIKKIETNDIEILIIQVPVNMSESVKEIKKEFERILKPISEDKFSILLTTCEFDCKKIKKSDLLKYGLKKVQAVQVVDI